MRTRILMASTLALVVGLSATTAGAQPPYPHRSHGPDAREAQMSDLHVHCDHGDRNACIKFGMMLQQNNDRSPEFRRTPPEWYQFER